MQQILLENPSAKLVHVGRSDPERDAAAAAAMPPPPRAAAAYAAGRLHGRIRRLAGRSASASGPAPRRRLRRTAPGPMAERRRRRACRTCAPPPPPTFDEVIVQFEIDKPLIKVAGVPPEEMRLDRYARTFRDSRHCRP